MICKHVINKHNAMQFWRSLKRVRQSFFLPVKLAIRIVIRNTRLVIVTFFEWHQWRSRFWWKKKYFMVTFPCERNFYDRQGNYFPPSYVSCFGGLWSWSSERHLRRETKGGVSTIQHIFGLSCFVETRVSSRSCQMERRIGWSARRLREINLLPSEFSRSCLKSK